MSDRQAACRLLSNDRDFCVLQVRCNTFWPAVCKHAVFNPPRLRGTMLRCTATRVECIIRLAVLCIIWILPDLRVSAYEAKIGDYYIALITTSTVGRRLTHVFRRCSFPLKWLDMLAAMGLPSPDNERVKTKKEKKSNGAGKGGETVVSRGREDPEAGNNRREKRVFGHVAAVSEQSLANGPGTDCIAYSLYGMGMVTLGQARYALIIRELGRSLSTQN
ncbi:uncharacterized protein LY79DRAFT_540750 [Colletotrichum navitas]|uniref:Uncharacterized protein n=1 Tax=Colletotrichum navitas TaxID=681940 RepID=A0AAD8V806_9PEZI|nr:uncharacterized protein LY79DRAFT_540750 [Colletotrichum navitas]KAK1597692.1 hypothetical protein LY79DRAFT_540750 [Colletotrichum navitas]